MTEEILHPLTKNEWVLGKIVYSTLFYLLSLDSKRESGAMPRIKKRQLNTTIMLNGPTQKMLKASCLQIERLKEESSQLNIEDVLEDMDL